MLTREQRKTLLQIARESIALTLDGRRPDLDRYPVDDDLRRPAGAFVTLNDERGDLRGCIGSIEPVAPLFRAVSSSAIAAAIRDPRFHPVRPEELAKLSLEISVMGPIERVRDVEEIEVGRDGLIIRLGSNAGLLLPQVASDYGWDRETFLSQTCIKAGLPRAAWHEKEARIERFSAEVFGELNADRA
jgi:AmmeMemoRadiSam system protein A